MYLSYQKFYGVLASIIKIIIIFLKKGYKICYLSYYIGLMYLG